MTYSKYFFPKETKIPIPLTIAVVILLIFFLARLFTTDPLPSRAGNKNIKALSVVNLTHNQAAIIWQTEEPETGWIIFGQNQRDLNKTVSDERDVQDKKNLFYNHYVIVKGLQPGATYYYKIVSNNQLVEPEGGKSFIFKTTEVISPTSNLNPAYGKIIKENGEPLDNAMVIIKFAKAYPLTTLSKPSGEWLIPLNILINKDTLKSSLLKPEDSLEIEIFSEDNKTTKIITNLKSISPLPQTVIIGKEYNFQNIDDVLAASNSKKAQSAKIEILFPKESAIIPAGRPLIKGTAIPGNEVEVTIEADQKTTIKTKTDKIGIWTIVLKNALSPGSHTIRIRTKGVNGKDFQMTRGFSIAKSGEQVLAAATPEATFTPTEVPTVFPTPTILDSPYITQTPTLVVSPPTSGTNIVPISVASASLIILGLGILLAF